MRLIKGNCLEELKNIPDGSVDLVLTDPPYKMTKTGNPCRENGAAGNRDENLFDNELPDTKEWMELCWKKLKPDTHFYVFTNVKSIHEYMNVAISCGFKLHNIIPMIKDTSMPNRWYLKHTELILFFRKGKAKPINDLTSKDYFRVKMPTKRTGKVHVTQKPLDLIEKLVYNSSNENDVVLDLFMGSGTTGVACKSLGRDFIGIEIDDTYFGIAKERIDNANFVEEILF